MKNVLVFALAGGRWAVELRWVREIISLNAITPIPTAPGLIAGAVNFRGTIVPVLAAAALLPPGSTPPEKPRPPRMGDSVILVDVDGTRAAFAADRIDEVTTLTVTDRAGDAGLMDTRGNLVPLIDPPAIVAEARRAVVDAAAAAAATLGSGS